MQFNFGAGNLFAIPNGQTPPSPIKVGGLQGASVEFSSSFKEAIGQYGYPLAIGRGAQKVTGKAKSLAVSAAAYNALYFNESNIATGQTVAAIDELGVIPSSTAYTVQVLQHTTWTKDLGVIYAATGQPMTCVAAGSEAAGKYSVSAGTYTFAVADKGLSVSICYLYTLATGFTITMTNHLMGAAPTFMGIFNGKFNGLDKTIIINNMVVDKLTPYDTKLEDFDMNDISYSGYVDASNTLGLISTAQ